MSTPYQRSHEEKNWKRGESTLYSQTWDNSNKDTGLHATSWLFFSSKGFSSHITQILYGNMNLGIFSAAVGYLVAVRPIRSVVGSPKKVSDAMKTVVH